MNKKFLRALLVFTLLINMSSIVFAEGEENSAPNDFTVQAIHQKYEESKDEYPMVLTLTNHTDQDVTVMGDVIISVKVNPHPMAEKEDFIFKLFKDAESIVVKAGEKEEIVEVSAGAPGGWQAFYHPSYTSGMDITINIEGKQTTFLEIEYGITGIIRNPLYIGKINSLDNEDGTATLKFKLTAYNEEYEIACNDSRCEPGKQCCIIPSDPEQIGLKTGLVKDDFSVRKIDGPILGEIIQAKEIAEGEYELVWQYEVGVYEDLLLNTGGDYGDFFVCESLEKAGEGNYSFNATITKIKDPEPVVIEHKEATLETVGATNIPKLATLIFREVSSEVEEDKMNVFEENVQKTTPSKEIVYIYDISLLHDGIEIKPDGSVKITIPLDEKMKDYVDLKIVYITDTGEVIEVKSELSDKGISFITDHFSYYAVVGTPKEVVEPEKDKLPGMGDSDFLSYLALFLVVLGSILTIKSKPQEE